MPNPFREIPFSDRYLVSNQRTASGIRANLDTSDDYYSVFKKSDPENLAELINNSLLLGMFDNATEPMKEIAKRANESLTRIARESPINAIRLAKYGIRIDDKPLEEAL